MCVCLVEVVSSNSPTFKVSSVRSILLPLRLWNLCDHVFGILHLLAVSEVIISGDLHTPGHVVHVHCAAEESMSRPRDFKSVYQVLKVRSSAQFYTLINIFFWKYRDLWVFLLSLIKAFPVLILHPERSHFPQQHVVHSTWSAGLCPVSHLFKHPGSLWNAQWDVTPPVTLLKYWYNRSWLTL